MEASKELWLLEKNTGKKKVLYSTVSSNWIGRHLSDDTERANI